MIYLHAHHEQEPFIHFSPDGGRLLTSAPRKIRCFDTASGKKLWEKSIKAGFKDPKAMFAADGASIFYLDNGLVRYMPDEKRRELVLERMSVFQSRGDRNAVLVLGEELHEWPPAGNSEALKPRHATSLRDYQATGIFCCNAAEGLVAALEARFEWHSETFSRKERERFWRVLLTDRENKPVSEIRGPRPVPSALRLSGDGTLLATVVGSSVKIWCFKYRDEIANCQANEHPLIAVRFTPDGSHLATAGEDGIVRVWETNGWSLVRSFDWSLGRLTSFDIAPDGMRLAVAGETGGVVIWDAEF